MKKFVATIHVSSGIDGGFFLRVVDSRVVTALMEVGGFKT
jgi:hypothetical protein